MVELLLQKDFVKSCNSGSDVVGLVLDRTPLYAEQGGQTFDKARQGHPAWPKTHTVGRLPSCVVTLSSA